MTQPEVKAYMKNHLESKRYKVIDEDGFLYAKGDIPVLLVAHMDTVHKKVCETINKTEYGRISSPQGIGGDDRCGVYIIGQILRSLHCSVLLCEDEEKGVVGANKFAKTDYIHNLGVNYMIEFDRHGNNDAVFYSCDNRQFIDFVLYGTGHKEARGTCSDISTLMPASKLCGVNLSSGYYNEHSTDEYVVYGEMMDTIGTAIALIKSPCDEPFVYKPKSYDNYNYIDDAQQISMFGNSNIIERAKYETSITLNVITVNSYNEEESRSSNGQTKAECWLNLFAENPNLCFAQIVDYVFI
jgi:hypothetical protein